MGGKIPNSAAVNVNSGGNVLALIPNPGFRIPAICKKIITEYAYKDRIYKIMGRGISITNMGRCRLQNYEYYRLIIK